MPMRFTTLAVVALPPFTAVQNGMIWSATFLDIAGKLVTQHAGFDERDLIGLVFHPGYANSLPAEDRRFNVFYTGRFASQL